MQVGPLILLLVSASALSSAAAPAVDNDGRCTGPSSLLPDQNIYADKAPHYICSPSGLYRFGLAPDNDIALWQGNEKIWSAGTAGGDATATASLLMQGDGNLVLRAADIQGALWTSKTQENPNAALYVEDDGQARIRTPNDILWESGAEVSSNEKTEVENCGHIPGSDPPNLEVVDVVDTSTLHGKIMAGDQGTSWRVYETTVIYTVLIARQSGLINCIYTMSYQVGSILLALSTRKVDGGIGPTWEGLRQIRAHINLRCGRICVNMTRMSYVLPALPIPMVQTLGYSLHIPTKQ